MLDDFREDVHGRVLRLFPERQIYLRASGEVKYLTLTTLHQVAFVSAVGFLCLWFVLSILNMVLGINPFSTPSDEMRRVEARYERMLADSRAKEENAKLLLSEQRESFERMAAGLQAKHRTLAELAGSDSLPGAASAPNVTYADARRVMAPTLRDADERTALRSSIETTEIATGLSLDSAMTALDEDQNAILMSAEVGLLDRIEASRALLGEAGLDAEELLESAPGGKGGPFIPLSAEGATGGAFLARETTIQARLAEAERLDALVGSMPLGHPVRDETVLTSDYGTRSDPFTGRPTMHAGHDYIGGSGAPIVATAPGTVRFVGRKGAYGRTVEIDHGYGYITRYAHLKKTFVKRGQTVETGEIIGGMGSTGRSTATHLHYEVRFQGRAQDPAKYLKAGRYVQ